MVTTIAERHIFNQPTLSPDAKRIALIKPDLDKETQEVWVYDIATGKGVQLTSNKPREGVQSPAWSPDGRFVAYVALRGSRYTILRKLSDGSGAEETIYAHEGGPIVLTDWSLDGRLLELLHDGSLGQHVVSAADRRRPQTDRNREIRQGDGGRATVARQPAARLSIE